MSKIPPSRIRYEQDHPTISFRVSKDLYDEVKQFSTQNHLSFGDFVRIALDKQKVSYAHVHDQAYDAGIAKGKSMGYNEGFAAGKIEGYKTGHAKGYEEGKVKGKSEKLPETIEQYKYIGKREARKDYRIWYLCSRCNARMYIEPMSPEHEFIIGLFQIYQHGHRDCRHPFD